MLNIVFTHTGIAFMVVISLEEVLQQFCEYNSVCSKTTTTQKLKVISQSVNDIET